MRKKSIIKEINQEIDSFISDSSLKTYNIINKDGLINIYFSNLDIYNPYSNKSQLSNDIYDYIENAYMLHRKESELSVKFNFDCDITKEEVDNIKKIIKTHYAIMTKKVHARILKNRFYALIMMLIGATLLFVYGLLSIKSKNYILQEIVEICSWVFIWEACHIIAFENSENKLEKIKYIRIFKAV